MRARSRMAPRACARRPEHAFCGRTYTITCAGRRRALQSGDSTALSEKNTQRFADTIGSAPGLNFIVLCGKIYATRYLKGASTENDIQVRFRESTGEGDILAGASLAEVTLYYQPHGRHTLGMERKGGLSNGV